MQVFILVPVACIFACLVPSEGALVVTTEFGKLSVPPNFACVIGRGMKFKVDIDGESARGYVAELFEGHFQLPELGPIGALKIFQN